MAITKNIVLFRKSRNIVYLLRAIKFIIIQGRIREVVWSLICIVIFRPSQIVKSPDKNKVVEKIIEVIGSKKADGFNREELIELYGNKYNVNDIPEDFYYVRAESIILIDRFLVLGEYAKKSARLLFITKTKCDVEYFYNLMNGVRHIHSIHKDVLNSSFLVSTGDSAKVLDRWKVNFEGVHFKSRIKKRMAGYTAASQIRGVDYFGTDFSSRPNYIETLHGNKYPFPKLAFNMFVISMDSFENRYLYIISKQIKSVGNKVCLSIFDVEINSFIYCDYLSIQVTGDANLGLPRN